MSHKTESTDKLATRNYTNDSRDSDDSFDWIREEEMLLKLSESNSFHLVPLQNIRIAILYVDRTQDVVDVVETSIDTSSNAPLNATDDGNNIKTTVIKWDELKRIIDDHLTRNGLRFIFNDAAYYHVSVGYDQLDLFVPTKKLIAVERDKDFKLPPSLPVFHDISQLFIVMREATYVSTGKSLKSILRTGSKIGKTKKVRISEAGAEIISSSRKTRKTA